MVFPAKGRNVPSALNLLPIQDPKFLVIIETSKLDGKKNRTCHQRTLGMALAQQRKRERLYSSGQTKFYTAQETPFGCIWHFNPIRKADMKSVRIMSRKSKSQSFTNQIPPVTYQLFILFCRWDQTNAYSIIYLRWSTVIRTSPRRGSVSHVSKKKAST